MPETPSLQRDLLHAATDAITNGQWTDGEQRGDWRISTEVYETLRDAVRAIEAESTNA